jgi:hypothetical protein
MEPTGWGEFKVTVGGVKVAKAPLRGGDLPNRHIFVGWLEAKSCALVNPKA